MNRRNLAATILALLAAPSFGSAQQPVVTPVGEVRVRWEIERPAVTDTFDIFTLLRTRLGVDTRFGSGTRAFVQVQDSRVFGEEASTLEGAADAFDLHQGWLELAGSWKGIGLAARAGRQEIALGSERLLGPVGWSNVGRSFDALRLGITQDAVPFGIDLLAATVSERGSRMGSGPADDDHTLLGFWAEGRVLDAFVLHDIAAAYRTFEGVDRTTAGARVDLPAELPVGAYLEGAYQLGNQLMEGASPVSQDIAAAMLGGRAWLPFEGRFRSLGVGADWLSGDEDPSDGEYQAFNTLYATNHKFYGYLDLFTDPAAHTGDRGLIDGMVNARAQLTPRLGLEADLHGFWFAKPRGEEDRLIGYELDLTLPFAMGEGRKVTLGYSGFRSGAGAPLIGRGEDGDFWHWGYVQASVSFGGGAPALAATR